MNKQSDPLGCELVVRPMLFLCTRPYTKKRLATQVSLSIFKKVTLNVIQWTFHSVRSSNPFILFKIPIPKTKPLYSRSIKSNKIIFLFSCSSMSIRLKPFDSRPFNMHLSVRCAIKHHLHQSISDVTPENGTPTLIYTYHVLARNGPRHRIDWGSGINSEIHQHRISSKIF